MKAWWQLEPFEIRRGASTSEYLARVLNACGLQELAGRAAAKHFDDYFCPPEVDDGMNMHRLIGELDRAVKAVSSDSSLVARIGRIRAAVLDGEFDGTKAESDQWARSPEGRAVMEELVKPAKGR